jgi:iron complex outermembrane recepter protein
MRFIRLPLLPPLLALQLLQAEEPVQLDPVEVNTPLPAASPLTQPAPVTAYSGEFIAATGTTHYAELSPLVPGFFVSEQSPGNPTFNIRGLTTDESNPNVVPRVSVFQDGVDISEIHGASVALFDIESVEVFKGPQPAAFSRGVEIGALSITGKKPRNETSASLAAGFGSDNARVAQGVVNVALIPDKLLARVAVAYESNDGYVKNLADGSGLQGRDTKAVRTSLRWAPSDATTADLIFNYQRDTPPGTAFKAMAIPTPGAPGPYTDANLNRGSALGSERDLLGLTGIVSTQLSPSWKLTSTTSGRTVDSREEFDADGSPFPLFEFGERFESKQLSQDFRLDYDDGDRLTASVGGGVAWRKSRQTAILRTDEGFLFPLFSNSFRQALLDNGVTPLVVDAILPGLTPAQMFTRQSTLPPALALVGVTTAGNTLNNAYEESYAVDAETLTADVFGEANYKIGDKLTVGGALRISQEHITSGYESFAAATPGNLGFLFPSSGGGNNVFTPTGGRLETDDDATSWMARLSTRYDFNPLLSAYGAVSRGRRPPVLGFDQSTLAPTRAGEESVWNYEAGVKGTTPGRRFIYGVSAFYYEFDGFQTQSNPTAGVTRTVDGGRANGYGLETTFQGTISRYLSLFGSYGFTDAAFSALDDQGNPQAFAGSTFRLLSRHSLSLGGTALVPVADHGAVFITPVWTYRSEHYFEDNNTSNGGSLRQGGFGLVNLRIGYRPRHGRWEAVTFVNNLFDKDYLIDAGNIGGSFGLPTSIRGAPRTYGAQFSAKF